MSKLIALDDGHGMDTAGKRTPIFPAGSEMAGKYMHEDEFNRAVVDCLKTNLERCGFRTLMVAPGDMDVPLQARTDAANKGNADFYISVHANALTGEWGPQEGVSVYHYPGSEKGHTAAIIIQRQLTQGTKQKDRGVQEAEFFVLKYTKMPAILCECAFMDNLREATLLLSDAFRCECAEEIAKGTCEYFGIKYVPEAAAKKLEAKYCIKGGALPAALLVKGSKNTSSAVKSLQAVLNEAGFNCGTVDGIFGAKTDKAVRSYQSACGLVVDGIVGPKTWGALLYIYTVEIDPMLLKTSLVSAKGSLITKCNFINANFFSGNKTIGWLASDGIILSERDNHKKWLGAYDKPKGTVIVYKDGTVDVGFKTDKQMDACRDKIRFCCQGFNLLPLDLKLEGFSMSEVGRACNSVMMGYNDATGKIIIAVRQGTNAYRAVDTMLELGCKKAIRLDSGGSANLWIDGKAIFKTDRVLTNIVWW